MCMKEPQEEIHKLDFNMPFSIFDKINEGEKNQQGYRNLDKTIKVRLMNMYETFAPKTAEFTFFTGLHETFTENPYTGPQNNSQ